MLTFIEMDADNVVGFRIDEKITGESFDEVATRMEKKMETHPKVRLYVEVESFEGFSFEALMKDLKFGLSNWGRFEKEAVVTEKKWMEKLADISDKIVNSIEVKAFPFEEKEQAKKWIQE